MKKNIIFDWSGTLLNNFDQIYKITIDIFKKLGKDNISQKEYRTENTSPYMKFRNKYFPKLTKEKLNILFSQALEKADSPKLYLGVKDILKNLHENNFKLFLLSSQPKKNLIKQMKELEVYDYFSSVTGDIYDKKIVFKKLINENNLSTDETICIGDTIGEVEAGKASKLTTVSLARGFNTKMQLRSTKSDYIIDDLSELLEIL